MDDYTNYNHHNKLNDSSLNWLKFINTDKKFNLVNEKFKFGTLFFRFIIWTI